MRGPHALRMDFPYLLLFFSAEVALGLLRGAIRAKTIATKNRPSTRRLEWNSILLTTLIAGNVKSLTLTSVCFRAAEVGTPCVAAWLTSLWVS